MCLLLLYVVFDMDYYVHQENFLPGATTCDPKSFVGTQQDDLARRPKAVRMYQTQNF
jgi:hypothetical protein